MRVETKPNSAPNSRVQSWIRTLFFAAACCVAAPTLAAEEALAPPDPAGTWTGTLLPGQRLELRNDRGPIRCTRAKEAGQLSLRLELPRTHMRALILKRQDTTAKLSFSVSSGDQPDEAETTLVAAVPDGVLLDLFSREGEIRAQSLQATVEAHSSAGAIVLDRIHGPVSASTDSAPIAATLSCGEWAVGQALSSDSGAITMELPVHCDLNLELTTQGLITTEYSIDIKHPGRGRPVKLGRVKIGEGRQLLMLNNRSGPIILRRLPPAALLAGDLAPPAQSEPSLGEGAAPVELVVTRDGPRDPLQLSTTSGPIRVLVEHGVSLNLEIATSGDISSDYSLELTHSWSEEPNKRARVRFGPEAPRIQLTSQSGAISILRNISKAKR